MVEIEPASDELVDAIKATVDDHFDVHPGAVKAILARLRKAERDRNYWHERYERLLASVTPSAETKAAYMDEFTLSFLNYDPDGAEVVCRQTVPWTTIKQIMHAIRRKADA